MFFYVWPIVYFSNSTRLSAVNATQYKTYFQVDFNIHFSKTRCIIRKRINQTIFGFSPYIYKLNDFPNAIEYHTWTALVSRLRTAGVESMSSVHHPFFWLPSGAVDVVVYTNPVRVSQKPSEPNLNRIMIRII